MKELKKHSGYYSSLFVIMVLGILLAYQVGYDPRLQMLFILLTAFCYVVWGVAHHVIEHDLSAKIVIEYVLMAGLGSSIVFFLLIGRI